MNIHQKINKYKVLEIKITPLLPRSKCTKFPTLKDKYIFYLREFEVSFLLLLGLG
jgi:hypothetical protein